MRLEDFVGCKVHFSYSDHQVPYANGEPAPEPNKSYHVDYLFELGDIDPTNIIFSKGLGLRGDDKGIYELPSRITIRTRNDEKKITTKLPWQSKADSKPDDAYIMFELDSMDSDYVVKFATAFKHAVEACGGKASLFADSHGQGSDKQPPIAADVVAAQSAQSAPPEKQSFFAGTDEIPDTRPNQNTAQSPPSRKDIPTIAKAANGAIVTIITANNDKPLAQGTGFLVSADGVIVTNYHVIENGNVAIVKFPDGTALPVDGVLAADKVRDLAIIKIHGRTFRTLTLGNSDHVQVGEEVVAIGNPLSLESTVSNGIISGVRTSKEQGGKFLQSTAPISPGSSGGPLFDMFGEVVGINTMYLEGGENLNFAIPANDAKLLLSHQSTKLQNLPNEVSEGLNTAPAAPVVTPPKESPRLPLAGEDLDSPAYRQYQELFRANDPTITTGTYACFYDSKARYKNFFVISATLVDKQDMVVLVNKFADGVLASDPSIFQGKIQQSSSKQGIFADLPTSYDYKNSIDKSHDSDVFKWVAGDIAMEAGWGKLRPGQVRMGYKFKMQSSTGRFVEDTELNFPGADSGSNSTIHEPGRCVRIPNMVTTPEQQFERLDH